MGLGTVFTDYFGKGADDYTHDYSDPRNTSYGNYGWFGWNKDAAGMSGDQSNQETAGDQDRQALLAQAAGINQTAGSVGQTANSVSQTADSVSQTAGSIGQAARGMGATVNGLNSLSTGLGSAPSAAQAAATAAQQRNNALAVSQAASARGANSALMLREAASNNDARSRAETSDAATAAATELANRYATRGQLLSAAGGVQANQAGAFGAEAGARASAGGLQNAAGGLQTSAGGLQTSAGSLINASRTGDIAQRGQDVNANQSANQLQQQHSDALYAAAAKKNEKTDSDTGGVLDSALSGIGGAFSDIRLKTDVDPLPLRDSSSKGDDKPADSKGADSSGMMSALLAAYGGGGGGGMAMSDEDTKTDIHKLLEMAVSPKANAKNLGKVEGYTYRYKPDDAKAIGQDTRERPGVMAQDVERAPAGEAVVFDTPKGKALDVNRALGFSMAGVAGLDKRLKALEAAAGVGRKGKAA